MFQYSRFHICIPRTLGVASSAVFRSLTVGPAPRLRVLKLSRCNRLEALNLEPVLSAGLVSLDVSDTALALDVLLLNLMLCPSQPPLR